MGRKERKEKREKIRESAQNGSFRFVSAFLARPKIKSLSDKFMTWAEGNRKKMFAITVGFLLCVFILSIVCRPSNNFSSSYREQMKEYHNKKNSEGQKGSNKSLSMDEVVTLFDLKREIEQIKSKDSLTAEDTAKMRELYNRFKNFKKEPNEEH